ncbi:hypothetical protein [Vreelandella alkaliphila]|uniref:hypothetical protein n=1 Tax=Vreelandella alkaliphila TaxID=272774 RepID=UPI003FD8EE05
MFKSLFMRLVEPTTRLSFVRGALKLGYVILFISLIVDLFAETDQYWFQRSGALLCMLAIAVEFRINEVRGAIDVTDEDLTSITEQAVITEDFIDTQTYLFLKYFSHFSIAVGTVVWAYGDIPFK